MGLVMFLEKVDNQEDKIQKCSKTVIKYLSEQQKMTLYFYRLIALRVKLQRNYFSHFNTLPNCAVQKN